MPDPVKPPELPKLPELPAPPSPEKLLSLAPPIDTVLVQVATSAIGGLFEGAKDFVQTQVSTFFTAIKPPGGK